MDDARTINHVEYNGGLGKFMPEEQKGRPALTGGIAFRVLPSTIASTPSLTMLTVGLTLHSLYRFGVRKP